MPNKLVNLNTYEHNKSKWITRGMIKSIHFRDYLYKQFEMKTPDSPEHAAMEINVKAFNRTIIKSNRTLNKDCHEYEALLNKFKDDIKKY